MSARTRRYCLLAVVMLLVAGAFASFPAPVHAAPPISRTVNSTADTGGTCPTPTTCTLRQAINDSNANDPGAGQNTITFALPAGPQTITFTGAGSTLILTKSVAITGPGAATLTVSAGGFSTTGVFQVAPNITATISGMTITGGNLDDTLSISNGAGVNNSGALTLAKVAITGNTAVGSGGGIYNGGTLAVVNSTVSGNVGAAGAGIANTAACGTAFGSDPTCGVLTVVNSTIAGNIANLPPPDEVRLPPGKRAAASAAPGRRAITTATGSGGGIAMTNNGTYLTLINSTIFDNSAATGGGIYNPLTSNGQIRIKNTIVTGNGVPAPANGPDLFGPVASCGSGETACGHNLIGDTTGSTGITNGTNGDIVSATPLLTPLADHGGTTQTVALLPGSPALDAGSDAVCALPAPPPVLTSSFSTGYLADGNGAGNTDQRGIARTGFGTHCDIGAFESRGFSIAATSGTPQSVAVNTAFASLVATVSTPDTNVPVDGITVTFVAPPSGASATLTGNPATTNTSGQASVGATANGTAGSYNVTATAPNISGTATFALTNSAPPQPNLTIDDVTHSEGNSGTTTYTFTVSLSFPAGAGGVTFDIATADGTAIAPGDYTAKSLTAQTIAQGSSTYTFDVVVNGDTGSEANETFFVNVTNVTGANLTDGQGLGTITNDDAAAPQSLVVTTTGDGPGNTDAACTAASCTLRQAVNASNGYDPGAGNQNTITFAAGVTGTITLANDAQHGTLTLTRSVAITGPTSGGAVVVDGGCTASCGTASAVGGVGVFAIAPGATVGIGGLTIRNGNAAGSVGGGIFNDGTLALTRVALSGNGADVGGGIYNIGTLTLTNATLSGNGATLGGGIYNAGGALTVTNATLSGNSAGSRGGGIDNSGGTLNLRNAIVAGNTAPASPDISGPVATTGNNLVSSTDGTIGIANGQNGDIVSATPLLGPLGDYGGPTRTIPLLPGSPAINAGASGAGIPTTDQRGVARVGATDIGAFESQGFTLGKTSGDPQTRPINTAFAPLVVTVAANAAGAPFNEPVNGGVVTFTGPVAGAGIQTSPVAATVGATTSGQASITPTANGTVGGPYPVMAAVATGTTPASVTFSLTNTPPGATHFALTGNPSTPAGQDYRVTVTAQDASNATVTTYTGTVHLTTNDPNARPINDHTFTAADGGVYTFVITLNTEGGRTITATDTANAGITGFREVAVTGPSAFSSGPALSAISPINGPVAGGTTITITGAGFTNLQSVTVGGIACSGATANGAGTSLTCVTGAHAAGTVDVTITTATGSYTAVGAYTYGVAANVPTGGRPNPVSPGNPNPAPPGSGGPSQPGNPNPAPPARPVVP